jgi:hypothetical protein
MQADITYLSLELDNFYFRGEQRTFEDRAGLDRRRKIISQLNVVY